MAMTVDTKAPYAGPPFFSFGFRPFFLFASLWAAVAAPIWVAAYAMGDGMVGGADGRAWHIHEMLFGYLGGVIAGFLLTAAPNWTGRRPLSGTPLALLFALWLAGRAAGFLPPVLGMAAAVIDSAFLVCLAGMIWREVLAARNRRNIPVCLMVALLAVANIAFHLRGEFPTMGPMSERAAVALITGLIALIGGRVTPLFTQNWTVAHGVAERPAAFGRYDQITLALTVIALAGWIAAPFAAVTGGLLIVCGLAHAGRLARWRGWLARRESMVWILHAGYAWIPIGLVLLGLSALTPWAPYSAGLHALTAGAMGVMTLAMMTRATRGHSGRPRASDTATTLIYFIGLMAALARVCAPFHVAWNMTLLGVSAALWSLAFLGFAVVYGPMLLRRSL